MCLLCAAVTAGRRAKDSVGLVIVRLVPVCSSAIRNQFSDILIKLLVFIKFFRRFSAVCSHFAARFPHW